VQGEPVELAPGALLRFAASSRDYILRLPHTQQPDEAQQPMQAPAGPGKRAAEAPAEEEGAAKRHERDSQVWDRRLGSSLGLFRHALLGTCRLAAAGLHGSTSCE
jgi:hypothetical protein